MNGKSTTIKLSKDVSLKLKRIVLDKEEKGINTNVSTLVEEAVRHYFNFKGNKNGTKRSKN